MTETAMPLKLLVCLGNPGREYQNTRHNAGWMAGDRILQNSPFPSSDAIWQPTQGRLFWTGAGLRSLLLLKPTAYMNRSGIAVAETLHHFRLTPSELLVICDDLDLPSGAFRLRQKGSSGGHRGLASIIQSLQSGNFPRLRLGIGRPQPGSGTSIVEWVLAPWVSDGNNLPGRVLDAAAQITADLTRMPFDGVLQKAAKMGDPRRTESNRSESQESKPCPSMN